MSYVLGLDFSTQSASACLLDSEQKIIIWECSFPFAETFPEYKTENGVLKSVNGEVVSPPLMWVESLEKVFEALKASEVELSKIIAISGSGQQHGSVYMNLKWREALKGLNATESLKSQLEGVFSKELSPIWMDTSTQAECDEIQTAVSDIAQRSGSIATMRFTGPQIRKFYKNEADAYEKTQIIHLVSSFIPSLLLGADAAIDHADGAGMNLMNLKNLDWDVELLEATAPNLLAKLPKLKPASTVLGKVSNYWVEKYGINAEANIVAFSGDNPCSLIGLGIAESHCAAISLGTSDTYFGISDSLTISEKGEGHVFASPSEGYMSLICFMNGSLAREAVRQKYKLEWDQFEKAVSNQPIGNEGKIMLPYFDEEITPASSRAQVYNYGLTEDDVNANCRAVLESQFMSMKLHSSWMSKPSVIHMTGGASQNETIVQIAANVFGAKVKRLKTAGGAGFGAALRALQAVTKESWSSILENYIDFDDKVVEPDLLAHKKYEELTEVYQQCEAHSLASGADPEPQRLAFSQRWK